MDVPEERQKHLTEDSVNKDLPEDLAIIDRYLEEPSTRADILHHLLTDNPTNTQRPDPPLLIDSEEIGVLKRQVRTTEQDMTALTTHRRK
jgi:hypothetical protein